MAVHSKQQRLRKRGGGGAYHNERDDGNVSVVDGHSIGVDVGGERLRDLEVVHAQRSEVDVPVPRTTSRKCGIAGMDHAQPLAIAPLPSFTGIRSNPETNPDELRRAQTGLGSYEPRNNELRHDEPRLGGSLGSYAFWVRSGFDLIWVRSGFDSGFIAIC